MAVFEVSIDRPADGAQGLFDLRAGEQAAGLRLAGEADHQPGRDRRRVGRRADTRGGLRWRTSADGFRSRLRRGPLRDRDPDAKACDDGGRLR
jgi:hypothetical protein